MNHTNEAPQTNHQQDSHRKQRKKESFLGISTASHVSMKTPTQHGSQSIKPHIFKDFRRKVKGCFQRREKERYAQLIRNQNTLSSQEASLGVSFTPQEQRRILFGNLDISATTQFRAPISAVNDLKALYKNEKQSSPYVEFLRRQDIRKTPGLRAIDRERPRLSPLKRSLPVDEDRVTSAGITSDSDSQDEAVVILEEKKPIDLSPTYPSSPESRYSSSSCRDTITDALSYLNPKTSSPSASGVAAIIQEYFRNKRIRTKSPDRFSSLYLLQKASSLSDQMSKPCPAKDKDTSFIQDCDDKGSQRRRCILSPIMDDGSETPISRDYSLSITDDEEQLPEKVKYFANDYDKQKEIKTPMLYKQLEKLSIDLESTVREAENVEKRSLEAKTARLTIVEDVKKIQPLPSSFPFRPFLPHFEPPPREFKEYEESSEEEEDEDDLDAKIFEPTLEEIEEYIDDRFNSMETDDDILIEMFDIPIKRTDLDTLEGLNWLNDEVINFYFSLIKKRSEDLDNLPRIYCYNTFFYSKLKSGPNAYQMLKRWTRKVDIFSFDYILIPLHLGVHWTLISVNCQKKRISYLDSMGGGKINQAGEHHQKAILSYLQQEHQEKKKSPLPSEWIINPLGVNDDDEDNFFIPQQENGCDCGAFICRFGEYISRRAPFHFEQVTLGNLKS